jgi:hypothetical protein
MSDIYFILSEDELKIELFFKFMYVYEQLLILL